jgi:hypothetical protein
LQLSISSTPWTACVCSDARLTGSAQTHLSLRIRELIVELELELELKLELKLELEFLLIPQSVE